MSLPELLKDVVCIDEDGHKYNQHSILVGKKCAYCMNCGQIIIEYDNKEDFKKLMNPNNIISER